jgi:hypothetical protein
MRPFELFYRFIKARIIASKEGGKGFNESIAFAA